MPLRGRGRLRFNTGRINFRRNRTFSDTRRPSRNNDFSARGSARRLDSDRSDNRRDGRDIVTKRARFDRDETHDVLQAILRRLELLENPKKN